MTDLLTTTSNFNRRKLLKAIGLAPVAAIVPAVAMASKPTSTVEQIEYHAAEIRRILEETTPKGLSLASSFFVIGTNVSSGAFPKNYKFGDTRADFETRKGGWHTIN